MMPLQSFTIHINILLTSFSKYHSATPDEATQPPVVETTESGATKDQDAQCPESTPAAPMEYTGNKLNENIVNGAQILSNKILVSTQIPRLKSNLFVNCRQ